MSGWPWELLFLRDAFLVVGGILVVAGVVGGVACLAIYGALHLMGLA